MLAADTDQDRRQIPQDVQVSSEPEAGSAPLNLQQCYKQMMRGQVTPALREPGYRIGLRGQLAARSVM